MENEYNPDATLAALDYFSLPAALVDLKSDRFICWNPSFADALGSVTGDAAFLKVSAIATLVWAPPQQNDSNEKPVSFATCAIKRPLAQDVWTGRAFRRSDDFVLFILDTDSRIAATNEFLRGVALGKREENDRIRQQFHDFISQQILLIAFEAHSLTRRLRSEGAKSDPELGRMIRMLDALIDDIQAVLANAPLRAV